VAHSRQRTTMALTLIEGPLNTSCMQDAKRAPHNACVVWSGTAGRPWSAPSQTSLQKGRGFMTPAAKQHTSGRGESNCRPHLALAAGCYRGTHHTTIPWHACLLHS
jgi:hypothetical protein